MFTNLKKHYDNFGIKAYSFGSATMQRVRNNPTGQGILEYGLIIAVVSLGVMAAVSQLGTTITSKLQDAAGKITSA